MKLSAIFLLSPLLLTACASIDNKVEAAKLDAAVQIYKQCIVERTLSNQGNVDMYCRPARGSLLQAVWADPRSSDKTLLFKALADNAVEWAKAEVEIAREKAPVSRSTR